MIRLQLQDVTYGQMDAAPYFLRIISYEHNLMRLHDRKKTSGMGDCGLLTVLAGAGQRRDAAPEWSAGTRDCCCGGPRENMTRVTMPSNVIKSYICKCLCTIEIMLLIFHLLTKMFCFRAS